MNIDEPYVQVQVRLRGFFKIRFLTTHREKVSKKQNRAIQQKQKLPLHLNGFQNVFELNPEPYHGPRDPSNI